MEKRKSKREKPSKSGNNKRIKNKRKEEEFDSVPTKKQSESMAKSD